MVSMIKIRGTGVAAVAVILLVAMLPSHASTMDEPDVYKHAAPTPSPSSYSPAPAPAKAQPAVIIVQGVIYCKTCKLPGYNHDMDASPLPNATAKLVCYGGGGDSKSGAGGGYRVLNQTSTTTDGNGYFLFMVYDVAMFRRESCRVYLRTSPTARCDAPFLPADASLGIILEESEKKKGVFSAESALMYAPRKGAKCPRYY